MKFLIVADPIEGLNPKGDTGLSMLREALVRGHDMFWTTDEDFRLDQNRLWVRASLIESCEEKALPRVLKYEENLPIEDFNGVWIRKDPPFKLRYLTLCWILSLEEHKISMINPPSKLLRYHEKLLPYEALRAGYIRKEELIPTYFVSGIPHQTRPDFSESKIISKPWFGYGGNDVLLWPSIDEAFRFTIQSGKGPNLFQPFIPTVKEKGDRRVLFIDGDYVGDVVRMPQKDSIRANLLQGGKPELREMSDHEKDMTRRIGEFLKSIGIFVAGADYIDEYLTEINITAPTGFEAVADLGQPNPRAQYMDLVERLTNGISPPSMGRES